MTMSAPTSTDVLIAGGGFVGLALAAALADAGYSSLVVEAEPFEAQALPAFDGRASAIAPDVRRFLTAIGVWERVAEAQPVTQVVVSDGRPGERPSPFFLKFEAREAGSDALFHMVENRFLRMALAQAVRARPLVRVAAPARIVRFEAGPGRVEAALSTGERAAAALLVAADGRDSPTREAAGLRSTGWSYGQWGIVATVAHERPHEGVAQEYFQPSGPFAILPLTATAPRSSGPSARISRPPS